MLVLFHCVKFFTVIIECRNFSHNLYDKYVMGLVNLLCRFITDIMLSLFTSRCLFSKKIHGDIENRA